MIFGDFRRLALSLPEAVESAHLGRPDFRVGGRIFATLWTKERRAVVLLSPEEQAMLLAAEPAIFAAVPGGWGRRGATFIVLEAVDETTLTSALRIAWARRAPKRLLAGFGRN